MMRREAVMVSLNPSSDQRRLLIVGIAIKAALEARPKE